MGLPWCAGAQRGQAMKSLQFAPRISEGAGKDLFVEADRAEFWSESIPRSLRGGSERIR